MHRFSLLVFAFLALFKINAIFGRIWAGSCGEPGMPEWGFLSRTGFVSNAHDSMEILKHVGRRVERGGQHELASAHRWLMSLRDNEDFHYGAASLIRVKEGFEESDIAITSACRCREFEQGDVAVLRTYDKQENGTRRVTIAGCYPHHRSTDPLTDEAFNIALLKLDTPIKFHNGAGPVCLPERGQRVRIRDNDGFSLGWNDPNDININTLREIKLTVIDIAMYEHLQNDEWGNTFHVDGRDGETLGCSTDDYGAPFLKRINGRYVLMGILVDAAPEPGPAHIGLPSTMLHVQPFIRDGWLEEAIRNHSSLWVRKRRWGSDGASTSKIAKHK